MRAAMGFVLFWTVLAGASCGRRPAYTVWEIAGTDAQVATDAAVYHLSKRGSLRALEVETGRELWRTERPRGVAEVRLAGLIADDLVAVWDYSRSKDGQDYILRAINRESGRVKWTHRSAFQAQNDQIRAAGGILYLIRYGGSTVWGEILAMDANTGREICGFNSKQDPQGRRKIWDLDDVVAIGDTVHFGAYSDDREQAQLLRRREVYYIYHDFILDSKACMARETSLLSKRVIHLAAFNGLVFSTLEANPGLIRAERANGQTAWQRDIADVWAPFGVRKIRFRVTETAVYYFDSSFRLHALNSATGEETWSSKVFPLTALPFPAIGYLTSGEFPEFEAAGGRIYLAGARELYCLDANTGSELWRLEAVDVLSPPAVQSGVLHFRSGRREMRGLDAATGTVKWRLSLPSWRVASAARLLRGRYLLVENESHLYLVDTQRAGT